MPSDGGALPPAPAAPAPPYAPTAPAPTYTATAPLPPYAPAAAYPPAAPAPTYAPAAAYPPAAPAPTYAPAAAYPPGAQGAASPFGSVDAGLPAAGLGTNTGFESVSIARGELRRLRTSRIKALVVAVAALGALGAGGYFGWQHKGALDGQIRQLRSERGEVERLTSLAKREAEAKQAAAAAAEERLAALGPVAEQAIKRATETAEHERRDQEIVGVLKDTLAKEKIELGSNAGRLTLGFAEGALFAPGQKEIAHDGMRMLYVMGKALKDIPGLGERHTTVVVTSAASPPPKAIKAKGKGKNKAPPPPATDDWALAAARGVALARFLVDDVGLPSPGVAVSTPAPVRAGKGAAKGKGPSPRLEIRFEWPDGGPGLKP